ncbi:MAG: three component ABC system middle component [Lachnospiraceae bacterium]
MIFLEEQRVGSHFKQSNRGFFFELSKIVLTPNGELEIVPHFSHSEQTKYADSEVKECLTKAEHVAKWFASAGKTETIYIVLGVRP